MQVHMDTDIAKDGSGTFTMSFAMSTEVAQTLQEMSSMSPPGQQGGSPPSLEDFDRDKIEATCKKHDVKLAKYEKTSADGKDTMTMVLEFKSLQDLSAVLGATQGEKTGIGIFKQADGNYLLKEYDLPAELLAEEEAEEEAAEQAPADMDPAAMGKSMELMGKLMASASELEVSMRITVPGEVISHNAMRQEDKTLVWEINSENMMTMQGGMEPEIVFSGQGLKIDAPDLED
jgi:hypothetical protein